MIKNLCFDAKILSQSSIDATIEDLTLANDLLDTINFHKNSCVGMALNMIGITKRIIVCKINNAFEIMINPKVIKKGNEIYEVNEGCLCHTCTKKAIRYKKIKLQYFDKNFKIKIKSFEGFEAQIIQHELDHLEGILI